VSEVGWCHRKANQIHQQNPSSIRSRCKHCLPGQPALCNNCGRASYRPADIGIATRSRQTNQPIVAFNIAEPVVAVENPPVNIAEPAVAVENSPVNIAEPVVAVENPPVNIAEPVVAIKNPPINMADLTQSLAQLTAMQRIMIDQQQDNQEQITGLHRENQRQSAALTVALEGHGGGKRTVAQIWWVGKKRRV
jgi:hypothetical protein